MNALITFILAAHSAGFLFLGLEMHKNWCFAFSLFFALLTIKDA